jgi:L-arabinonolactonase
MRAALVIDCANRHGEGVVWSSEHQRLMWTDIHGQRVWTLDPETGIKESSSVPERVCCFAPRAGRPLFQVIAAFAGGIAFLNLASGEREDIHTFEPDLPQTRTNDGRTDRQGRLIVGGMDEVDGRPVSSVVRIDPDGSVSRLFGDVACANGTCFSPDGRIMYFADSPSRRIEAFDYDGATGIPSNRRTVGQLEGPGVPDGSCVDAEGCVWNAVWEGYRVERWSPDGRLDRVVEVPVKKPTCCAFGGLDLATLFITSSRLGESDDDLKREPTAGGLFAVKPGIAGLADTPFAG